MLGKRACSITLPYGYRIPDSILENMELELNVLGLFIRKERNGKQPLLVVEFEDINDMPNLSTAEISNIFHAAFSNYILDVNLKYHDCLGKVLRDFLNTLTGFLVEFVTINNNIDNYIPNRLHPCADHTGKEDEKLKSELELNKYNALIEVKGDIRLSDVIAILPRGSSVIDAITEEELNNYSYKRNIRSTSLDIPRRFKTLVLGLKPKRKTKAKVELITTTIDQILYLIPNHSGVLFSLN